MPDARKILKDLHPSEVKHMSPRDRDQLRRQLADALGIDPSCVQICTQHGAVGALLLDPLAEENAQGPHP